jgi:hypothetical protein
MISCEVQVSQNVMDTMIHCQRPQQVDETMLLPLGWWIQITSRPLRNKQSKHIGINNYTKDLTLKLESNEALGPLHHEQASIAIRLNTAGDEPLGGKVTQDSNEKL